MTNDNQSDRSSTIAQKLNQKLQKLSKLRMIRNEIGKMNENVYRMNQVQRNPNRRNKRFIQQLHLQTIQIII